MILTMLTVFLWACSSQSAGDQPIVRKVKTEKVALADTLEVRSISGIISEAAEINLAFRVAGSISRIAVKEGDYVRAGQVIALMDTRDYELQLRAAQAQYDQVKAEAERVIELFNRQSVSPNDHDKAVSGLRMVEAQLKRAKDQLNDTRLLAPASGYIQKVNFRQNELIDAGMPVATLIDVSQYHINVDIPLALFIRRNEIISFSAVQPLMAEKTFPLSLMGISRKAGQNQLFRLQLALDSENRANLAPGMDVIVNIVLRSPGKPHTSLPLSALLKSDNMTLVWVYDSATKRVNQRQVTTGNLLGNGRIRIETGLEPGEQVVVAGVSLLDENDLAEPIEQVSETNIGGLL